MADLSFGQWRRLLDDAGGDGVEVRFRSRHRDSLLLRISVKEVAMRHCWLDWITKVGRDPEPFQWDGVSCDDDGRPIFVSLLLSEAK